MGLERATDNPTVTVVIPVYDRRTFVRRAIDSVIQQSLSEWQLIVVDDASTVDIASEIADYLRDPRIMLFRRNTNGGLAAARNSGIDLADGEFVCFLDDDDEIMDHKLERQVETLTLAPHGVVAVAGITEGWGQDSDRKDGERWDLRRDDILNLTGATPAICALLVRRDIAALTRFDETFRAAEDWDFYARLLEHNRIVFENILVARVHHHGGGHLSQSPTMLSGRARFYEKYREEICRDQLAESRWHEKLAWNYLHWDCRLEARRHTMAALRLSPSHFPLWAMLGRTFFSEAWRRRLSTLRQLALFG